MANFRAIFRKQHQFSQVIYMRSFRVTKNHSYKKATKGGRYQIGDDRFLLAYLCMSDALIAHQILMVFLCNLCLVFFEVLLAFYVSAMGGISLVGGGEERIVPAV